ncbi:hypothetical protein CHELA1G2_10077 [Hyphomicrobiales bacterium]|nr:hypothetical protein CHELA1G2_10077 [Hyphomicrobiales bacterium]
MFRDTRGLRSGGLDLAKHTHPFVFTIWAAKVDRADRLLVDLRFHEFGELPE